MDGKKATVKLEELRVEEALPWRLRATGEKEHRFRKWTIADSVWVKQTYQKSVQEILRVGNEVQFSEICRIWLRVLEDKSPFKPTKREVEDEDTGEKKTVTVTGSQVLMEAVAADEVPSLFLAFAQCIRASEELSPALAAAETSASGTPDVASQEKKAQP